MVRPLYQHIASTIDARATCITRGNTEWRDRHETTLNALADLLPSGAGIDNSTAIDWEKSMRDKLVLHVPYHHMNDGGYYIGWTEHTITVRPSLLSDFVLTISGPDKNSIKDYLYEVFDATLRQVFEHTESGFRKVD